MRPTIWMPARPASRASSPARASGTPSRPMPVSTFRCASISPRRRATGTSPASSSALAITQVALGHAVAAVLEEHHEWDVAGAACLALEAGAVIVDGEGRPDPLPAGTMIVAVPGALDTVLGWWRDSAP